MHYQKLVFIISGIYKTGWENMNFLGPRIKQKNYDPLKHLTFTIKHYAALMWNVIIE